jgi:hypothetical protein
MDIHSSSGTVVCGTAGMSREERKEFMRMLLMSMAFSEGGDWMTMK